MPGIIRHFLYEKGLRQNVNIASFNYVTFVTKKPAGSL